MTNEGAANVLSRQAYPPGTLPGKSNLTHQVTALPLLSRQGWHEESAIRDSNKTKLIFIYSYQFNYPRPRRKRIQIIITRRPMFDKYCVTKLSFKYFSAFSSSIQKFYWLLQGLHQFVWVFAQQTQSQNYVFPYFQQLIIFFHVDSVCFQIGVFFLVEVTPMHLPQAPLSTPHYKEEIAHKQVEIGKEDSNRLHDIPREMLIDVVVNQRVLHEQKGGIVLQSAVCFLVDSVSNRAIYLCTTFNIQLSLIFSILNAIPCLSRFVTMRLWIAEPVIIYWPFFGRSWIESLQMSSTTLEHWMMSNSSLLLSSIMGVLFNMQYLFPFRFTKNGCEQTILNGVVGWYKLRSRSRNYRIGSPYCLLVFIQNMRPLIGISIFDFSIKKNGLSVVIPLIIVTSFI